MRAGMVAPGKHQRPGRETEAPKVSLAGDTAIVATDADHVVRCTRCRHRLTAPASVEIEIGPVCRKAVA